MNIKTILIDFMADISEGLTEGSGSPDLDAKFSNALNDTRAVNRESTARVEDLDLDTPEKVDAMKRAMLNTENDTSAGVASGLTDAVDDVELREARAYLARRDVQEDLAAIKAEGEAADRKAATEQSFTEAVANNVRLDLATVGYAVDPATGADLEAFEDSERAQNWLAIPDKVREEWIESGKVDPQTAMELSQLAYDYLEDQRNTRIIDSEASRIEGVTDALSALAGELRIPDADLADWTNLILQRASEYAGADVSEMAPGDADAAFRAAVEVERGMQAAELTAAFKRSIMEAGIVSGEGIESGLVIGGRPVQEQYEPTVNMGPALAKIEAAMQGRKGRGSTSAEVRRQVAGKSAVETGMEGIHALSYKFAAAAAKQRGR